MPFKIVRNDITKMQCDAIVNTANEYPVVGRGCDTAIYEAAGYQELLTYRREHIGQKKEGEVFITPGFHLQAKYIIHAVSPAYMGGTEEEEQKLRSCYRGSLELALQNQITSIAFPLIATGSYHYPKEEGMRIAVDEINAFLLRHDMLVYLVVYDDKAVSLGKKIYPNLESYIDRHYFEEDQYRMGDASIGSPGNMRHEKASHFRIPFPERPASSARKEKQEIPASSARKETQEMPDFSIWKEVQEMPAPSLAPSQDEAFGQQYGSGLEERLEHLSDTFSEYLMYLIKSKGMTNADVYKGAIVDKKVFSKIKNNRDAHPQKMTAMCLCIGARLNMDESRDLLARAGYALSPSNKTDVIFAYFIENQIYDMIELDIQLEEHGLPCLIS